MHELRVKEEFDGRHTQYSVQYWFYVCWRTCRYSGGNIIWFTSLEKAQAFCPKKGIVKYHKPHVNELTKITDEWKEELNVQLQIKKESLLE